MVNVAIVGLAVHLGILGLGSDAHWQMAPVRDLPIVAQAPNPRPPGWKVTGTEGAGARLREGPSLQADTKDTLNDGTLVDPVGGPVVNDGVTWSQVKTRTGDIGWVADMLLEPPAGSGVASSPATASAAPSASASGSYVIGGTDGQAANFRDGPGTDATIIGTLAEGTPIEPLAETRTIGDQTWRKVRANSREGWVVSGVVHTRQSAAP